MAHEDSDILAVAACLREALRQKDMPVALSLMTDDVVLVGPVGAPVAGLDAVRAALSAELPWKYVVSDTSADVTVEVLGDIAIVVSDNSTVATPLNSALPTVRFQGRAISVFRRQVDGWKLARCLNLMAKVKM